MRCLPHRPTRRNLESSTRSACLASPSPRAQELKSCRFFNQIRCHASFSLSSHHHTSRAPYLDTVTYVAMTGAGGASLMVTMKADPVFLGQDGVAMKPARGTAPWFQPGWAKQFTDLAPPPPPVDRATLLEMRGAPVKDMTSAPAAEATARAVKPVEKQDTHLDEHERLFRDELAVFLNFRSRHELYSPIFLGSPMPMRRVFKKVRAMGGYRAVCDSKLWMRVCREASGGKDLSGQTSASFAMRRNYEKTGLLEMERSVDGTSLPGGLPFVVFDPDAGKDFMAVDSDEICQPGTRVRVLWNEPNGESAWYGATVQSFDETTKKHKVLYDDETEEAICFGEENVEAVVEGEEE